MPRDGAVVPIQVISHMLGSRHMGNFNQTCRAAPVFVSHSPGLSVESKSPALEGAGLIANIFQTL
jgi:hypothetical protein